MKCTAGMTHLSTMDLLPLTVHTECQQHFYLNAISSVWLIHC